MFNGEQKMFFFVFSGPPAEQLVHEKLHNLIGLESVFHSGSPCIDFLL